MIWLNEEQLIYLHEKLIEATGGSDGLRDKNLLRSALAAPMQTYDTEELFPSVIDKAARLACGITQFHPFVDGNKRLGAHAMTVVLELNGFELSYTQKELSDIFMRLAENSIDFTGLCAWVRAHVAKEE